MCICDDEKTSVTGEQASKHSMKVPEVAIDTSTLNA